MKRSEIAFGILRIPVDILMTVLAFNAAYHLRTVTDLLPGITLDLDLSLFPPLNDYIQFSIIAGVLLFIIFVAVSAYYFYVVYNAKGYTNEIIFKDLQESQWRHPGGIAQ